MMAAFTPIRKRFSTSAPPTTARQDGPKGLRAHRAGRRPQRRAVKERRLGLYTLGRIFEQSITELEILEAEADGRVSLNTESKRKRDGV